MVGRTGGKDQAGGKAPDSEGSDLEGHPGPLPIQAVGPEADPAPPQEGSMACHTGWGLGFPSRGRSPQALVLVCSGPSNCV